MVSRQQKIILLLREAEGQALTSEQLARQVGVSSRTIKAEMPQVAKILEENGARLSSRQNYGYSIEVVDSTRYLDYSEVLSLKSVTINMANANEDARLLYTARKLVASTHGVTREELARALYISPSALRVPLSMAERFCESFYLTVNSSEHKITVTGQEYQMRIAMTELFQVHFHKAKLDASDQEYAQWIACEYQERQDIRHTFLRVLRGSGISLRDSVTQRIAMYLVLARNRWRNGFRVVLPARWMQEIAATPLYRVSSDIFEALQAEYADYKVGRAEISFLAIYILCGLDVNLNRDPATIAPFLAELCEEEASHLLGALGGSLNTDLSAQADSHALLVQCLMPILARARYGLDGNQQFNYAYEKDFLYNPLCKHYAHMLMRLLQKDTGCSIAQIDLATMACFVYTRLQAIALPIKPLRLIDTHFLGAGLGSVQGARLKARFPELIASITSMELYEIRGIDPTTCDAVLLGNCQHDGMLVGYNYEYPASSFLMIEHDRDFRTIYNKILVKAYQMPEICPAAEDFRVMEGFYYDNPLQFFQHISQRHALNDEAAHLLFEQLREEEELHSKASAHFATVVGERSLCRRGCMELYHLPKGARWGPHTGLRWILFVVPDSEVPARLHGMMNFFDTLTEFPDKIEQFAQNPPQEYRKLVEESLQYD